MQSLFLLLILISSASDLTGQPPSNTLFNMLKQPLEGVSIGQGESGTAAMVGLQSYLLNPAHINHIQNWEAFYSYQSFGGSASPAQGYFSTGAAGRERGQAQYGIYIRRFNFGVSHFEQENRSFDVYDMALGAIYGRQLTDRVALGITINYLRSVSFEGLTINSFSTDIGLKLVGMAPGLTLTRKGTVKRVLRKIRMDNDPHGVHFGVALLNVGPNVSYTDAEVEQPIPQRIRFGVLYQAVAFAKFGLKALFDLEKELTSRADGAGYDPFYKGLVSGLADGPTDGTIYHVGAEVKVLSIVTLRAGYRHQPGRLEFNSGIATIGAGIDLKFFSLHFGQWLGDVADDPYADTFVISIRAGDSG